MATKKTTNKKEVLTDLMEQLDKFQAEIEAAKVMKDNGNYLVDHYRRMIDVTEGKIKQLTK